MKNLYTIGILLVLTIITAIISKYYDFYTWAAMTILVISAMKFLFVAFQFMELKQTHNLWKGLVLGYIVLFLSIIGIILI